MRQTSPEHAAARSRVAPPSSAEDADPPARISSEAQSSLPAFRAMSTTDAPSSSRAFGSAPLPMRAPRHEG